MIRVSLVKRYSGMWFNYPHYRRRYDIVMDRWQYETRIVAVGWVSGEAVEYNSVETLDRSVREMLRGLVMDVAERLANGT